MQIKSAFSAILSWRAGNLVAKCSWAELLGLFTAAFVISVVTVLLPLLSHAIPVATIRTTIAQFFDLLVSARFLCTVLRGCTFLRGGDLGRSGNSFGPGAAHGTLLRRRRSTGASA